MTHEFLNFNVFSKLFGNTKWNNEDFPLLPNRVVERKVIIDSLAGHKVFGSGQKWSLKFYNNASHVLNIDCHSVSKHLLCSTWTKRQYNTVPMSETIIFIATIWILFTFLFSWNRGYYFFSMVKPQNMEWNKFRCLSYEYIFKCHFLNTHRNSQLQLKFSVD